MTSSHGATTGDSRWIEDIDNSIRYRVDNFNDPHQEWRRLVSEVVGTFLLVIAAAGAPMVGVAYPGTVGLGMAVTAPALMVLGVILFMGKVGGAHLNPAVSFAFALRGDFPWKRVPGYVVAQLVGATIAAAILTWIVNVSSTNGGTYPGGHTSSTAAFFTEMLLTFGLVSVILGTASGAQNVGLFAGLGVAGYITLAGLWAAPLSGASMNPARTFGPNFVGGDFGPYWVYLLGPLLGAALAVGLAFVLRGPGGGRSGSMAAQGELADQNIGLEGE